MASLIHFRVTPEKWLELACNVVIWGLQMGCMMVWGRGGKGVTPVGLH